MPSFHQACQVCWWHHGLDLIKNNDESAYRDSMSQLALWCAYNLKLNITKTVEIITDFQKYQSSHPPLFFSDTAVKAADSEVPGNDNQQGPEMVDSHHHHHQMSSPTVRAFFLRLRWKLWTQFSSTEPLLKVSSPHPSLCSTQHPLLQQNTDWIALCK